MKLTLMQEKILNTAESLIQKLGYNAFSYKDIALTVGIKTSSIHYYYPTKEDLAVAVIEWQLERLSVLLNDLKNERSLSLKDKLLCLVDTVMSLTINDEMKMCLGGMLASDVVTLPEKVRLKVRHFFNILEQWIRDLIEAETLNNKALALLHSDFDLPRYLLVQIEGGVLMSRLYDDLSYIETVKQFIQKQI
ncbi:putative HTH-type transcriptional regulator YxaF [Legionella massiliensis]|uniref:Putative HTH-type transcriptional regulator YxaF n=1 Tax=Legionella massiliensis TaxID=1034943 RepID=A0A078KZH6_9GAMM|nr:TetR/AcrR family transcriptional regulator [Legionella massiliensis]CDZ77194.1 putative HTH-type transcriptional regulator YxaF [Legionella massiliensis]CEE12932.1 putative HTH-type transcriptional regulator YxaF [Legionella massiliensis]